jgi:hypothetical protein
MTVAFKDILLWLFVIDLGITFGAGLYENRMIVPQWFGGSGEIKRWVNSEAMRRTDAGRRFWAYVTTVPLTLLTLASLFAACQSRGSVRDWWLGAAVITLLERLGTFSFFIPTALKLMRAETLPESKAAAMASRWIWLNRLRITFNLAGWLAALKVFSLFSALNR